MYYPLFYYKGPDASIDPFEENRQKQLVRLIRILFLKRFESSAVAFESSCQELLLKMLSFVTKNSEAENEKRLLERWMGRHAALIGYVHAKQLELLPEKPDEDSEDIVTAEMLGEVERLPRDEYKVQDILQETYLDLDELVRFLEELKKFKPAHDDKLKAFVRIVTTDPVLPDSTRSLSSLSS